MSSLLKNVLVDLILSYRTSQRPCVCFDFVCVICNSKGNNSACLRVYYVKYFWYKSNWQHARIRIGCSIAHPLVLSRLLQCWLWCELCRWVQKTFSRQTLRLFVCHCCSFRNSIQSILCSESIFELESSLSIRLCHTAGDTAFIAWCLAKSAKANRN